MQCNQLHQNIRSLQLATAQPGKLASTTNKVKEFLLYLGFLIFLCSFFQWNCSLAHNHGTSSLKKQESSCSSYHLNYDLVSNIYAFASHIRSSIIKHELLQCISMCLNYSIININNTSKTNIDFNQVISKIFKFIGANSISIVIIIFSVLKFSNSKQRLALIIAIIIWCACIGTQNDNIVQMERYTIMPFPDYADFKITLSNGIMIVNGSGLMEDSVLNDEKYYPNGIFPNNDVETIIFTGSSKNLSLRHFTTFDRYKNLTTVRFDDYKGIVQINSKAFRYCYNLALMVFPPRLELCGTNCFEDDALTEVRVPSCLYLDKDCFMNCKKLKAAYLMGTMMLSQDLFIGCESLTDVYYCSVVPPTQPNPYYAPIIFTLNGVSGSSQASMVHLHVPLEYNQSYFCEVNITNANKDGQIEELEGCHFVAPQPTKTPSLSPSPSQTPTQSPSFSPSQSQTPTQSPSFSPSQSPTQSPSSSPSQSQTPTQSPSSSPSKSQTPTQSPSFSPSQSPTKIQTEPIFIHTSSQTPLATLAPTESLIIPPVQAQTPKTEGRINVPNNAVDESNKNKGKKSNTASIIGGAVGGFLFLLLLILIVLYIVYKSSKHAIDSDEEYEQHFINENDDSPLNNIDYLTEDDELESYDTQQVKPSEEYDIEYEQSSQTPHDNRDIEAGEAVEEPVESIPLVINDIKPTDVQLEDPQVDEPIIIPEETTSNIPEDTPVEPEVVAVTGSLSASAGVAAPIKKRKKKVKKEQRDIEIVQDTLENDNDEISEIKEGPTSAPMIAPAIRPKKRIKKRTKIAKKTDLLEQELNDMNEDPVESEVQQQPIEEHNKPKKVTRKRVRKVRKDPILMEVDEINPE